MLGENLLSLRKLHKMSQEEVASRIGVSRQTFSKWETGENVPDINSCQALAALFEISLDELVSYSPAETGLPLPPQGKHVFGTVTVGDKGQIVIPKKARDVFHIRSGDQMIVLGDESQGIAIVRADRLLKMLNEIKIIEAASKIKN